MSKAVLIIDMPDSCSECDLYSHHRRHCGRDNHAVGGNKKPGWCPLISQTDDETAWYDQGYIDGWNDCLDSGGDFTKRKPGRKDD